MLAKETLKLKRHNSLTHWHIVCLAIFLTVCVGIARQRYRLAIRLQEQTQQLEQLQALRQP